MADVSEKQNSGHVEVNGERDEETMYNTEKTSSQEEITLYTIFNRLVTAVLFPNSDVAYGSAPLLRRIKVFLSQNVPLLREAFKNSAHHVLLWTRRGTPLRALLVVSVSLTRPNDSIFVCFLQKFQIFLC